MCMAAESSREGEVAKYATTRASSQSTVKSFQVQPSVTEQQGKNRVQMFQEM